MNLTNETYQSHNKEGNTPIYVNKFSNHPPTTMKEIPTMIKRQLKTSSTQALL